MEFNCNDCKFISITEEEQHKLFTTKMSHTCLKYKKRVIHNNNHIGVNNYIKPCKDCSGKDFVIRVE